MFVRFSVIANYRLDSSSLHYVDSNNTFSFIVNILIAYNYDEGIINEIWKCKLHVFQTLTEFINIIEELAIFLIFDESTFKSSKYLML